MAVIYRVRPQPCAHCGEKVVIVESSGSALGGLVRRSARIVLQHADFEPDGRTVDRVDDACERPRVAG